MDFALTEEQKMLKAMVHDFAVKELEPIAAELDKTAEYPVDAVKKIGELGLMIGHVHLVLKEDQPAARARFAIGRVPQRIVRPEAFRGFAAADAAGDVVFFVNQKSSNFFRSSNSHKNKTKMSLIFCLYS